MTPTEESVAKLKAACDAAYDAFGDSCSHAVMSIIKAVYDSKMTHFNANGLIDEMTSKWSEVTLDDGHYLANLGYVIVGGKKESGHGHVVAIYPGSRILNGGYQYYYAAGKKNLTMARKTYYSRCLSTSLGTWPGAMSKGDKTVWDPWAKDSAFKEVKFWAQPNIWNVASKPNMCIP